MNLKNDLVKCELVRRNLLKKCEIKCEFIKNCLELNVVVGKVKFLYLELKNICNNLETIKTEKQEIDNIKNKVSDLTMEEIKAHLEHYKYHFNVIKEECNNFWHKNANKTIDKCKKRSVQCSYSN
jgi:hypothetical protein